MVRSLWSTTFFRPVFNSFNFFSFFSVRFRFYWLSNLNRTSWMRSSWVRFRVWGFWRTEPDHGDTICMKSAQQSPNSFRHLSACNPPFANDMLRVSRALENAGSRGISTHGVATMEQKMSLQDEATLHVKLGQEWNQLLTSICAISGFEDFLRPVVHCVQTCSSIFPILVLSLWSMFTGPAAMHLRLNPVRANLFIFPSLNSLIKRQIVFGNN